MRNIHVPLSTEDLALMIKALAVLFDNEDDCDIDHWKDLYLYLETIHAFEGHYTE